MRLLSVVQWVTAAHEEPNIRFAGTVARIRVPV